MNLARVVGSTVSSVKDTRLTGMKLLLVEDAGPDGAGLGGTPYVAGDMTGAGDGELVLVVRGSPAARSLDAPGVPIDALIVGIVDSVRSNNTAAYEKP
jgi:microcompartment protein CcmK/EutM